MSNNHGYSLTETHIEQVLVMRKLEDGVYNYRNCFPNGAAAADDAPLNITWREKICHWCYNVVDHFDLSREVVSISLNIFDRYLATRSNKCNGNMALLTSLATLHLAIKLHETKKVKLSTLANLSRGQFGPKHIEAAEWSILTALEWRVHPPTESAFLSHLLVLFPQEAHYAVKKDMLELSRYLCELAVCDAYFVDYNKSAIAFASILNVMEDMSYARLSAGTRERFLKHLKLKIGLNHVDPSVKAARERIKAMYEASISFDDKAAAAVAVVGLPPPSTTKATIVEQLSSSSSSSKQMPRSRANSGDSSLSCCSSKGSCRYSPSPVRAMHHRIIANVSPMGRTRSSPIVAIVR